MCLTINVLSNHVIHGHKAASPATPCSNKPLFNPNCYPNSSTQRNCQAAPSRRIKPVCIPSLTLCSQQGPAARALVPRVDRRELKDVVAQTAHGCDAPRAQVDLVAPQLARRLPVWLNVPAEAPPRAARLQNGPLLLSCH